MLGLYAGKLEDAKEEVRNNPDDADAHYNLGNAYGELGRYEEAIEPFKQEPEHVVNKWTLQIISYSNTKNT